MSAPIVLGLKRLAHAMDLPLPALHSAGAAGFDLAAALPQAAPLILAPGRRALIPTGLVFVLPPGCEAQIRPRSGLALKFGIGVLNSPGTIDADYRGEVQVLLINHGEETFEIRRGDRIAQCVVAKLAPFEIHELAEIDATARGAGGFGSTGI